MEVKNFADLQPINIIANDTIFCKGDDIFINTSTNGCNPLNYIWQKNNIDIPEQNKAFLEIQNSNYSDSGFYRCIVSNNYGVDTSNIIFLKYYAPPSNEFNINNLNLSEVEISYTGDAKDTAIYNWTFSNAMVISGTNKGPYVLRLDDAFSKQISVTITQNGCLPETYHTFIQRPIFENINPGFPTVDFGVAKPIDFDNDGFTDVFISGDDTTCLYKNINGLSFTPFAINFPKFKNSFCDFGDFDNDGFIDIAIIGELQDSTKACKIYKNHSGTYFSEIQTNISGISKGAIKIQDFNNDGMPDILCSGLNNNNESVTTLYRNNGNFNFKEIETGIINLHYSCIAIADYNKDTYLDLFISGSNDSLQRFTKIYKNINGNFYDIGLNLTGVNMGSADWFDYDNDGNLDFIYSGFWRDPVFNGNAVHVYGETFKLYKNIGYDNFNFIQEKIGMESYTKSSLKTGDYNNDGLNDLTITGIPGGWASYALALGGSFEVTANINRCLPRIYKNKISLFEDVGINIPRETNNVGDLSLPLEFISFSQCWLDYNNDGKIDLLRTGKGAPGNLNFSTIYKNGIETSNSAPAIPANLTTNIINDSLTLSWNKSTDDHNPQNTIQYRVYLRKKDGEYKISPVNQHFVNDTVFYLKNPEPGTYFWSVQSIDYAQSKSSFAPEDSFTISGFKVNVLLEGLYNNMSNGLNKTFNESGAMFSDNTADIITVELHNKNFPYNITGSPKTANIQINGNVNCYFPPQSTDSCYIVIKHRNHIETWSSSPVSFTNDTVTYDFTIAANKAYGSNQKEVAQGIYAIMVGDVNQDNIVDLSDLVDMDTDLTNGTIGYVVYDLNGDGVVDLSDLVIIDENLTNGVVVIKP